MSLQTNSGNSGGPVLNRNGEVIGVAVASHDYFSLAIPANLVKILLAQTHKIEPLTQWQEKQRIRAYACLVQGQNKHAAAQKKQSITFYDEAIIDLDEAIQLHPDYVHSYYNRGAVKSQLGLLKIGEGNLTEGQQHYRDAIADYTQAIKLCPDYASAYSNRGAAKSDLGKSKADIGDATEAQHLYQNAIADYTQAIKLYPDYASVYNNRAYAKYLLGKSEATVGNAETAKDLYQKGIIDSNTSIKLVSDFDKAYEFYHTRGEIKIALGAFREAIDDLDQAIKLKPDYIKACQDREFAKKALREQEKIKRDNT